MKLRRFNKAGMVAFQRYLDRLRSDPKLGGPNDLVEDPALTELLEPEVAVSPEPFDTRMAFAVWLDKAFRQSGNEPPHLDAGFWVWLTAALFDQVCPADGNGRRKPGEQEARFIPEMANPRLQYRHLLYGSTLVYNLHRNDLDAVQVLLATPLDQLNHFFYQLASRREILGTPNVMSLATDLYLDRSVNRGKRGAVTRGKPGTVFRFVKVLNQLDRTIDLRSAPKQVIDIHLPKEFDRFRPSPSIRL